MKTSTVVDLDYADLRHAVIEAFKKGNHAGCEIYPKCTIGEDEHCQKWHGVKLEVTIQKSSFLALLQTMAGEQLKPEQRVGASAINVHQNPDGTFTGASVRFQLNGKP